MHAKAKKSKNNTHWEKFRGLRQLVNKRVAHSYQDYINTVIGDSLKENPKRFWSFIKLKKTESVGIPTLVAGDQPKVSDKDKANALNNQFKSVFTAESAPIPGKGPSPFTPIPTLEFGMAGVSKQLESLNPNKACGPDELPARILRETASAIAPMVRHIFQQSYTSGKLPTDWSKALVTAIYKKGAKSDPANYRPISLTCILCKVMEHIVLSHMWRHLKANNIVLQNQHGFQSGLSCDTQLIEATDDWASSLKANSQVDVILLDFSKAFDRVAHQRLLAKLQYYGIDGMTQSWIQGFLSGRTQRVSVNGIVSDTADVTSGVPQGSVLGPVLFLLYINDITDGIQSDMRLFADDSIVYREIHTDADHNILQRDLEHLAAWAHLWQMDFNVSKCYLLTISLKKETSSFDYQISGQPITRTTSHPYLGVVIDSKLSWTPHVREITAKASRVMGLLRRTLHPCKPHVKEIAYKTLVRPKVEYGATAWNPHTTIQVDKIEKIQRSAARFVANDHRRTSSVTAMLNRLKWQSLESRRLQQQLLMLYKIKTGLVNIHLPPTLLTPSVEPGAATQTSLFSFILGSTCMPIHSIRAQSEHGIYFLGLLWLPKPLMYSKQP